MLPQASGWAGWQLCSFSKPLHAVVLQQYGATLLIRTTCREALLNHLSTCCLRSTQCKLQSVIEGIDYVRQQRNDVMHTLGIFRLQASWHMLFYSCRAGWQAVGPGWLGRGKDLAGNATQQFARSQQVVL